MVEMHFSNREKIVQQGDTGNTFYILCKGEVSITKDGKEIARLEASQQQKSAHYFGEQALLHNEPRAATVRVASETAQLLALDRESFNLLLGPLQDIIEKSRGKGATRPSSVRKSQLPDTGKMVAKTRVNRKDLTKVGMLGCGAFGAVELWEHKKSGETYALKGLSKGFAVRMR